MHGLMCKSLEGFVRDQHGDAIWRAICRSAGLSSEWFESLRTYDGKLMERVISITARTLGRKEVALLEDVGHWVCTHPPLEPVRRLIRFSGSSFVDLLYSLDEMDDRARIALPGLRLPKLQTSETGPGLYRIDARWQMPGAAAVLTGMLRAMADDYGALALIETVQRTKLDEDWFEVVSVTVVDQAFHEPREFALGGSV